MVSSARTGVGGDLA